MKPCKEVHISDLNVFCLIAIYYVCILILFIQNILPEQQCYCHFFAPRWSKIHHEHS